MLRGLHLAKLDDHGNSNSDPYLVLKLGKKAQDTRKEYIKDVTDANFYKHFEFSTSLPGDSLLQIQVLLRLSFTAPCPFPTPSRPAHSSHTRPIPSPPRRHPGDGSRQSRPCL